MTIKNNNKEKKTDRIALLAEIIAKLARSDTSFGVSELGRECSKSKMYIHRLLSSLESIGWVSQDRISQKYTIGNDLITLGILLTYRFSIPKITLPYLYELTDITNETSAVSLRIGYERLFVQEIPGQHENHQRVILGQRNPLWLGATGKSMAAYLSDSEIDELINRMRRELPSIIPGLTYNSSQYRNDLKEIRTSGYAISAGEYRPDICVLAAPIFDKKQSVIGSLMVRGKSPIFNLEMAKKYSTVIREMTNKITQEIQNLP